MGLIKRLINVPEAVYSEAEKQMLDETPYRQALDELYERFKKGEITKEDYEYEEEEILVYLREIRRYKREHKIWKN